MSTFLYQLFVRLYPFIIKLASPFNQKASFWIKGRKDVFTRMKAMIGGVDNKIIWMHCSSLGEFEQGRPLLEKLKLLYPSYKVLLTFFSPSGYEVRKNYTGADFIFYLPNDSAGNASTFYDIANPQLVIFVKYEFWYYYLNEAKKRKVPLLLISAIFRKQQPFFSKQGGFHRTMLSCFNHIFVQNSESSALLKTIEFSQNVSVSGDTRFDRVVEIAEKFQPVLEIEYFCKSSTVVVAGSTWLEDDKELAHYANTRKATKFIIAPHDIGNDRLKECMKLYKHAALFSSLKNFSPAVEINTIIIDNIGMLSRLYKYATVAYVGGGFGADGVHNVLEAAVYGKPVLFGPVYEKFNEAIELIKSGGATSVENALDLEKVFDDLMNDQTGYQEKANASLEYVKINGGATDKILRFIQENRLLTS